MRDVLYVRLSVLAASVLFAGSALAQTATTDFNVQITITAECVIDSATDLDFGSSGFIDADIDAANAVTVTCTNGTGYEIGLDAGQGVGATVASRLMTGTGGETIAYSLYQDAGRSQVWGDTQSVDTVSATGTGTPQTYDVFGRVPAQNTPPPGDYADIVTVTVSY